MEMVFPGPNPAGVALCPPSFKLSPPVFFSCIQDVRGEADRLLLTSVLTQLCPISAELDLISLPDDPHSRKGHLGMLTVLSLATSDLLKFFNYSKLL